MARQKFPSVLESLEKIIRKDNSLDVFLTETEEQHRARLAAQSGKAAEGAVGEISGKAADEKTVQTTIKIPESLHRSLKNMAKQEKTTISALISGILSRAIATNS